MAAVVWYVWMEKKEGEKGPENKGGKGRAPREERGHCVSSLAERKESFLLGVLRRERVRERERERERKRGLWSSFLGG